MPGSSCVPRAKITSMFGQGSAMAGADGNSAELEMTAAAIILLAGYFLGGKWADANPTPAAMYRILAWGAFTIGLVPYIAGPVLRSAATAFEALSVGTSVAVASGSALDEITPAQSPRFSPTDTQALTGLMVSLASQAPEDPQQMKAWAGRYADEAYRERLYALLEELR